METLTRWAALLSGAHQVQFLCSFDHSDPEMTQPSVIERLHEFADRFGSICKLTFRYGMSKSKIEAVNADMDQADPWDMLILMSDDMTAQIDSYDDVIARDMLKHFPNLGGCLRYADGRRSDLCTLSIFGKPWYDAVGYVYCPDFFSLFSDDHFQWIAEAAGKMEFIPDKVPVRHEWINLTGHDALHAVNSTDAVYRRDEATFRRLKAQGIPQDMLDRLAATPR